MDRTVPGPSKPGHPGQDTGGGALPGRTQTSQSGAGPGGRGGRGGREEGPGGGAGAARGGGSAEAAGAAAAPGSRSGGRAMWLLGPLCLLLSSAAGESEGFRRTSRGAGRGGRAVIAPPPRAGLRLRARVCTEGGPRRRAGLDPGEGPRRGARRPIVWACAPASAVLCVRGRSFVCSPALGSPAAVPIGRSSNVSVLCVLGKGGEEKGENISLFPSYQAPRARCIAGLPRASSPVACVHPRASVSPPGPRGG